MSAFRLPPRSCGVRRFPSGLVIRTSTKLLIEGFAPPALLGNDGSDILMRCTLTAYIPVQRRHRRGLLEGCCGNGAIF